MITHIRVTAAGGIVNPTFTLVQQYVDGNGFTIHNQTLAVMDYAAAVELRRDLDAAIAQVDKARQAL